MDFQEAKAHRDAMEKRHKIDSDKMAVFEKYRNSIGLLPDNIRESSEYKALKRECDKNFAELRNFNQWFVKTFKKEIQADRRKRFSNK